MKYAFFFLISSVSAASQACPDITGYYKGWTDGRTQQLERFEQSGCDQLTIGILSVTGGKISDEIFPAAVYTNTQKPELCPNSVCLGFDAKPQALTLYYQGSTQINRSSASGDFRTCFYNEVDYTLTAAGDLKKTYHFEIFNSDANNPCTKPGANVEILKRATRP